MCHGLIDHEYSLNTINKKVTKFGACQTGNSGIRCVMQSWDCESNELWVSPTELENLGSECNCNEVKVGACSSPIRNYCAIDSDSCDDGFTFVTPLTAQSIGLDCTLCDDTTLLSFSSSSRDSESTRKDESGKRPNKNALQEARNHCLGRPGPALRGRVG